MMNSWICLVGSGWHLYFVIFFTSLTLLDKLSKKGIVGCGTLREYRLEKSHFCAKESFEKTKRVTAESCSDGNNLVIRLEDKKVVTCSFLKERTYFAMFDKKFTLIVTQQIKMAINICMYAVRAEWTCLINSLLIIAVKLIR